MTAARWTRIYAAIITAMLGILAGLFIAVPRSEDGMDWTAPMIKGGWMAWTFPVALFFFCIASLLIVFTLLAIRFPETPRGDRLFITLLGSAFINLGWLFFFGAPLTGALILCPIYALAVFRWV